VGARAAPTPMTKASSYARRLLLLAATTVLVVGAFSGSASGRAAGVQFVAGNSRVVQGNEMTLSVSVSPGGSRCALAVRYKSGAKQRGLPVVSAASGHATWTWKVPRLVQPGRAVATASCPGAGRATKAFTVIGQIIPPKITVVKSGWTVRNYPYGGSAVSYGVILHNESTQSDAVDVEVLVNFVMADNRLIGSATSRITDISAGSDHALGGELSFPGGAPIARLEVVIKIAKRGPATHAKPGISAVRVLPSVFEPAWCGSIEGELQNDQQSLTLQSAQLSAVVLDADGNVIGGGSGGTFASLPPSARIFFKITTGMRPIPLGKAATALVSVVPAYQKG
jgi:hypothetical protein